MPRQLPNAPKQPLEQVSKTALDRMNKELPYLQQLWSHDAKATRLKMVAYLDEGFTREEAFILATRKA